MTNERCEHKKMSVSLTTAKLMESIDCPWCEIERLRCIPQSFDEWWAANPEPWNDARTLAALAWNAASRSAHEPRGSLPMDAIGAICHEISGTCCHVLGDGHGPCTIANCSAVRGYLGGLKSGPSP